MSGIAKKIKSVPTPSLPLKGGGYTNTPSPFQGEGGEGVTLTAEDNPHPDLPPERGKEFYEHRLRDQKLKKHSRRLRRDMTDVERKLWYYLRREHLGVKFRRQYPIALYIVDFVCLEKKLIVELDGGQHALRQHKDKKRDMVLKAKGFTVLRFWNDEVLENMEGVLQVILDTLQDTPPPKPSPSRRREVDVICLQEGVL